MQVSQRVRRLDTAQANLAATIDRIQLITSCAATTAAVQSALDARDYESLATHISEYQELQHQQATAGGELPAQVQAGSKVVAQARETLLNVVREKVKAALDARDSDAAASFLKLYKPLQLPDEGMSASLSFVQRCAMHAVAALCKCRMLLTLRSFAACVRSITSVADPALRSVAVTNHCSLRHERRCIWLLRAAANV